MTNRTRVCAMALVAGLGADAAETHGTHEHGHAALKLAQDGADVVVHFESPLESIVGFEHAPANDAHRAALEEAARLVAVSENIIRLPEACTLAGEPEVDFPYVAEGHGDHGDDDHDDHEDGRSGGGHDDHTSESEAGDDHHADEDAEVHADLKATFNYRCESGIEWLEATVFETFDGLEEVELEAVGADAAVVETLTAASPRAVLTGF